MESNILEKVLSDGIECRIREEHNAFLGQFRCKVEELCDRDIDPKELRKQLLQLIESERMPGYGRYYR